MDATVAVDSTTHSSPAPLTYDGPPETRAFWCGSLPHWDVLGRPVFLTIHVRGAVPAEAVTRIREEARTIGSGADTASARRLKRIFANMERWLDRADGEPLLTRSDVSTMLREAMNERMRRGCWRLMHWVILPSHLHVLYVPGTVGMRRVLGDFKRWTGHEAGRLLGATGKRFWQDEWFDHWSRSADETDRIASYIRSNPVRAGLVQTSDEWPHGSWSR